MSLFRLLRVRDCGDAEGSCAAQGGSLRRGV